LWWRDNRENLKMTQANAAYNAGYADGVRGHTDYFRPNARYSAANREDYSMGYADGARHAHDAGLVERKRLAAINLPKAQRA
jgi:hypothetical protein